MRGDPSSKKLEEPSGDEENSACIGEETKPESTCVQADASFGPEADQVYGSRWDG